MLYVIYGKDNFRSREKFRFLTNYFLAKTGEHGLIKILPEEATFLKIEEASKSASLFSKKHVVLLERWLEEERPAKELEQILKIMAGSPNVFILWEEEITKDVLEPLENFAEKIEKVEPLSKEKVADWIKEKAPKASPILIQNWVEICGNDLRCLSQSIENFSLGMEEGARKNIVSPFALADALLSGKKGEAWLVYQREILRGAEPEDLFWKAWWQIKTLLTVFVMSQEGFSEPEIAELAGINPYPVKKSLRAVKFFKKGEIENLTRQMILSFHESRRGKTALNIAFERILLKL